MPRLIGPRLVGIVADICFETSHMPMGDRLLGGYLFCRSLTAQGLLGLYVVDIWDWRSEMEIFGLSQMESLWLILMIVMLVIELGTVGLTCIWFAGGALVALLAAAFEAPIFLQVILFLGVSILMLIFTRPWAIKYVNSRKMRTNYEATIGKHVVVLERVDNVRETGKARLEGMEWTARAVRGDMTFEPDEEAVVVNVVGVKLILDKLPGPELRPIDGKSVTAAQETGETAAADTAEEHV